MGYDGALTKEKQQLAKARSTAETFVLEHPLHQFPAIITREVKDCIPAIPARDSPSTLMKL